MLIKDLNIASVPTARSGTVATVILYVTGPSWDTKISVQQRTYLEVLCIKLLFALALYLVVSLQHCCSCSSFLLNLVTLDYKTLMLLLVKKNDDKFMLGGRGVSVEFCFICNAIRVSTGSILKSVKTVTGGCIKINLKTLK